MPALSTPLISVVLNGCDSERYLPETLQALLAQEFKDWELVFWDSASKDGTLAQVRACADERFRIIENDSRPLLGEARDRAVRETRGEWVAFLDHDDLWSPEKLARQVALLGGGAGAGRVGMIYGRATTFSADGGHGEAAPIYSGRDLPEGRLTVPLLRHGCFPTMSSVLVRRSAYLSVGGIPHDLRFAEDYHLYLALAEEWTALCDQEAHCRYRLHGRSATATMRAVSYRETLSLLDRWGPGRLPPRELAKRKRVYETLLGVDDMVERREVARGLAHVWKRGSWAYFFGGALRRFFRARLLGRRHAS
jgi:glycosyltransferase involved in cell wall biosynthesis